MRRALHNPKRAEITKLALILGALMVIATACGSEQSEKSAPWVIGQGEAEREEEEARTADAPEEARPEVPCVAFCEPNACGDDGCGGRCGPCGVLAPFCFAGFCQSEVPQKEPTLEISPPLVDFGTIALGEEAQETLTLRSMGKASLEIYRFGISGDGAFVVMQGEHAWRSTSGKEIVIELNEA